MLNKINESCQFLLQNYPEAQSCREYLDSRVNKESQLKFGFGYFPNFKNISSLSDLISDEVLLNNKLLYNINVEDSLYPRKIITCHFEDHPLIIPYRDAYGNVMGLVGRTLLNDEEFKAKNLSKYRNTYGLLKGRCVFGLFENKQNILDKDCVYVVEGQFDAIKATEKGFNNIVAIGGANMTPYQFAVICRYTNNIFLLLDNDEAGQKGRKSIIDKFGKLANFKNFYLPKEYKDIDQYYSSSNSDDIELLVEI